MKAYHEALGAQRHAQNAIIAAETKRTQILSAIDGIEKKIDDLKDKIEDLEGRQAEYEMKKKKLLEAIAGQEAMKAKLLAQVEDINSDLADRLKELAQAKEECQSIMMKINRLKKDLADAEDQLRNIVIRRMQAEKEVADRENEVQGLRKRLQAAENDLADAHIRLSDILDMENNMPAKIEAIKAELADAQ